MYILKDNSGIELLKVDYLLYKVLENNNFPVFKNDGEYYFFSKTEKLEKFIKKHKLFIDVYSHLFIK